jgi:hypothetical protein
VGDHLWFSSNPAISKNVTSVEMLSRSRRDLIYNLMAPVLIILTPFVSFTTYNRYSYAAPEFWICVAGLVALALLFGLAGTIAGWPARVVLTAGLLVLFVDVEFNSFERSKLRVIGVFLLTLLLCWAIKRHLSLILTAVFATMLAATVVFGEAQDELSPSLPAATLNDPKPQWHPVPTFVHLVLDEYIGIEGIPADVPNGKKMRAFLRDFFDKYGFRLFGRAYSRYASTYNAIPNIVNFSSEPIDAALVSDGEPYVLLKNTYFERMHQSDYRIHVYQSDYIDVCKEATQYVSRCYTTPITGIKAIELLKVSLFEKVTLIYRIYARRSILQVAIGRYYNGIRDVARSFGLFLPRWWLKDARLGPLPSMRLFDRVTVDVSEASPGDMFFVYLPIPHFPYVYDDRCDLYPMANWEWPVNPPSTIPNDRRSRARRYGRYLEQMTCLHRRIDTMFKAWQKAGIFDRLVIVMHGDHGSKIVEHRANADNEQKLSRADYVDTFSTLFAVKEPGVPAGYDRRIVAAQELLEEVVARQTGDHHSHIETIPYVFLSAGRGKPMLRQPLPAFGGQS